ncbi:ef7ec3a8-a2c2-44b9-a2bd-49e0d49a3382 [Sclerotinia trifoliorum]|uniref:Ef7ec3a8-a2c2-44b9-a2bd-49e0d49a3382 n=1 Tax=Sclerotinia trifoliorum TaxID=28548 RepID=A0A8H2W564_9HELO|nr:ef7ec3a8-a2c2-44b9-a2bd-49e0d49a3382 [Sclerotinia trifoliorum]
MLGGIARTKIAPAAKSCPSLFTRSTWVKSDAVPRKCVQIASRNLTSKSKVPLISTRQFRSNASGRAAVTDLPMFHDGPMPAPYEPPNTAKVPGLPVYDSSLSDRTAYWQKIPRWKDITEAQFLKYKFHTIHTISTIVQLETFMLEVLPPVLRRHPDFPGIVTREDFIEDVKEGIKLAPMSIRLPPHILSIIDWENPFDDPIRRQFIPMKSSKVEDHPKVELDSLHESEDSPVEGFVHRYFNKALFLATSQCPLYCRFCTRSWSIGPDMQNVKKTTFKPQRKRWEDIFTYIEENSQLQDIVVSGGDCYILTAENIRLIGERLISIPHIKRFRFATKGLAVSPARILDDSDGWAAEMIRLSALARKAGKSMAIHTHFNHPREMTWVSRMALQRLHENNVTVRNQTVLLKGVNDDVATMSDLIKTVADNNIIPYYVYQADMVQYVEDLRTPLSTILQLERHIRGSIGGFVTPNFVVDLPGGGGKRLAASYDSYDPVTGRSTFTAPAVTGKNKENRVYEYWDPLHSLPKPTSSSS